MTTSQNYNQPTPPNPPADPGPRRTRRFSAVVVVSTAIAALTAGGLTGLAIGGMTSGASESCHAAVVSADTAMELYSESLDHAADGIRGYSNDDPWAIRRASDGLGDISEELTPVLDDYHESRTECYSG